MRNLQNGKKRDGLEEVNVTRPRDLAATSGLIFVTRLRVTEGEPSRLKGDRRARTKALRFYLLWPAQRAEGVAPTLKTSKKTCLLIHDSLKNGSYTAYAGCRLFRTDSNASIS